MCVVRREFVSVAAMLLACVLCARAIASHDVFLDGDDAHVGRIDTAGIVAKMVHGESIGNLPDDRFVGVPMSRVTIFQRRCKAPVASGFGASPFPAIVRLADLGPKTNRFWRRLHPWLSRQFLPSCACVVLRAKPTSKMRLATPGDRANGEVFHDTHATLAVVTRQEGAART